jgi:hypothetical protein
MVDFMRTMIALVALFGPAIAVAQVTSSENMGCTVIQGGMSCNGLSPGLDSFEGKKGPKLRIWNLKLEPGAAFVQPSALSDCVVLGINGGEVLNEKAPFLNVSLAKNSVILMPKELPFRLRNKGTESVELRVIEIQR